MLNNLKALVVVLALAWAVFRLARPLCLQYMSAEAFARRRNVWFALTIVAFVSPTFWSYGLFALILLWWAGARDDNPLALYVFVTFTVPDASFSMPTFLVNQLFDLTQYRILSLVILIPAMVRGWKGSLQSGDGKLKSADWFLLAFLLVQVAVQFPYESITAVMRRSFLLAIDTFVVFYAFSRLANKQKVSDVVASFWLACAVMAPIAVFEWAKGWLLYTGLSSLWGDPNVFAFIMRGSGLRAQAAANHSLNLGYLLAVSLAFLLVQVAVQFPYESITAVMRRSFLLAIDTFVVFYAFSRLANKQKVSDVVASFWLACAVMAPIAVFEWAKGWLLYTGLSSLWGDPNVFAFIMRGSGLRAQAAANHSLNLGYLLAVGLAFFLYLRQRSTKSSFDWLVIGVTSAGLFASGSRAAWIMGALVSLIFVMFRPGAARKLAQAAAVGAAIIGLMYLTPLKESVIDRLPVIGNTDQGSVDYRQQLYDVSMPLIWQNPFFGDPFVTRNMESMRQGQGIIDIVNGYLFTALFFGLVGLFLQMAALLTPLWIAGQVWRRARSRQQDAGLLGAGLLAAFIGSLFFIATAGFGPTTYLLAGLLLSYARCVALELDVSKSLARVMYQPAPIRNLA